MPPSEDDVVEIFDLAPDVLAALMADGRTFQARVTPELAELLEEVGTLERARARLLALPAVTTGIDTEDGTYCDMSLPPDVALELLDGLPRGGPLVLGDVDLPAIRAAAELLADRFDLCPREDVRMRLLVSRAGRHSQAHFDDPAGLNLQIAGRKRWRVASQRPQLPPRGVELCFAGMPEYGVVAEAEASVDRTIDVGPGDSLFIPAGAFHEVRGIDDSVSLVISFRNPETRWADAFVGVAKKLLMEDARARAPFSIPERGDRARELDVGRSVLERLERRLAALSASDLLPDPRACADGPVVRWNPVATVRTDLAATSDAVVLTIGIAGFMGEVGRMTVTAHEAAVIVDLSTATSADRVALTERAGRRGEALLRGLSRLGALTSPRDGLPEVA